MNAPHHRHYKPVMGRVSHDYSTDRIVVLVSLFSSANADLTVIRGSEICSAIELIKQFQQTLLSVCCHPYIELMLRIQITETPVLRFPRIKLCRGVHILKSNRVFSVVGLRDPLRFAVFLPVVILQSNPFIEPSRNSFLCFGGKARAQFRMSDLMRQNVEFDILVRNTDIVRFGGKNKG